MPLSFLLKYNVALMREHNNYLLAVIFVYVCLLSANVWAFQEITYVYAYTATRKGWKLK